MLLTAKKHTDAKTTVQICKMINDGVLCYHVGFQRGFVWTEDNKQDLIHSIINGYHVPQLVARFVNDVYEVLDGKQRTSTVLAFTNDEFTTYEGKLYSELDADAKKVIDTFKFSLVYYKDMTDDERNIMFKKLNHGVALKKWDLTRVDAGTDVLDEIQSICKHPLFAKIGLSDTARNNKGDEELVVHSMMVLEGVCENLSAVEIAKYTASLRKDGINPVLVQEFHDKLDYLYKLTLTDKQFASYFKKSHFPMILHAVNGQRLEIAEFTKRITEFFKKYPAGYKDNCGGGMNNYTKWIKRDRIMYGHFNHDEVVETLEEVADRVPAPQEDTRHIHSQLAKPDDKKEEENTTPEILFQEAE